MRVGYGNHWILRAEVQLYPWRKLPQQLNRQFPLDKLNWEASRQVKSRRGNRFFRDQNQWPFTESTGHPNAQGRNPGDHSGRRLLERSPERELQTFWKNRQGENGISSGVLDQGRGNHLGPESWRHNFALGQPQNCPKLKSQLFSSSHLPRGQCLQPSNCEGISFCSSPTQSCSSGLISSRLLLSCRLTHRFSSLIFQHYLTFNFFSKLSLDSTFWGCVFPHPESF